MSDDITTRPDGTTFLAVGGGGWATDADMYAAIKRAASNAWGTDEDGSTPIVVWLIVAETTRFRTDGMSGGWQCDDFSRPPVAVTAVKVKRGRITGDAEETARFVARTLEDVAWCTRQHEVLTCDRCGAEGIRYDMHTTTDTVLCDTCHMGGGK